MWKSILCLCFLAIAANGALFKVTDEIRQFLATIKLADLPVSLQQSLTASKGRAGGDTSHWCCINEQPLTIVTQTKVEYATHIVQTKVKVGYVSCGFMGTMRCSTHVSHTRMEHYTFIQTFQIPNQSACKPEEVKCCSGHMLVAQNCLAFAELIEHQELFQFLSGIGLLGPTAGK